MYFAIASQSSGDTGYTRPVLKKVQGQGRLGLDKTLAEMFQSKKTHEHLILNSQRDPPLTQPLKRERSHDPESLALILGVTHHAEHI